MRMTKFHNVSENDDIDSRAIFAGTKQIAIVWVCYQRGEPYC